MENMSENRRHTLKAKERAKKRSLFANSTNLTRSDLEQKQKFSFLTMLSPPFNNNGNLYDRCIRDYQQLVQQQGGHQPNVYQQQGGQQVNGFQPGSVSQANQ